MSTAGLRSERLGSEQAVRRELEDWMLPPAGRWAMFPTGRLVNTKARAFADFIENILNGDGLPVPDSVFDGCHSNSA